MAAAAKAEKEYQLKEEERKKALGKRRLTTLRRRVETELRAEYSKLRFPMPEKAIVECIEAELDERVLAHADEE